MEKNRNRVRLVVAAILIVYEVVAFAVPFQKNLVFWISNLLTAISICSQLYFMRVAFHGSESVRSKFYGFPIAKVGAVYLLVQIVDSLLFMGLAAIIPAWIPVIVYVLVLAAAVIGLVAADAMREEVERQDVQLKKDVSCMRALQSKAIYLARQCEEQETAAVVSKFAEELRYSDPVSSKALENVEADLTACVDELQRSVVDGDTTSVRVLCQKASTLLAERNYLCKLNKGNK